MINLGLHIINSKGQKAFVGDKIKLDLLVQGWINKEEVYTITKIDLDGTITLNNYIGQHISGIKDFRVISRLKK